MDNKNRACMVDSDEEDEDGNLAEVDSKPSSNGNESSLSEEDENYEEENLSSGDSYQPSGETSMVESDEEDENMSNEGNSNSKSKSNKAKSKIAVEGEFVYLPEDSSTFQPEDPDENDETLDDSDKNSVSETISKAKKGTGNKNKKSNLKTKTKVSNKKSKTRRRKVSMEDDSDNNVSNFDSDESSCNFNSKNFAVQPTPLCDAIMKDIRKKAAGSNLDDGEPNDESIDLKTVNKVDPSEHSNTDTTISDPLLVKKEDDIKLEIKEEIDIDEKCIKPFSVNDDSTDLVYVDDCQEVREDQSLMEDNEPGQRKTQNKRKILKRKNDDDDPIYSPKTKKQCTLSDKNNVSNQQEKTNVPTKALSKSNDTQNADIPVRRRGRPSKYQVISVETNKESENNLLSDVQTTNKKGTNISTPKVLPGRGSTQRKSDTQSSSDLPNDVQPITLKKRGRPSKAKDAESSQDTTRKQKQSVPTTHVVRSATNYNFDDLPVNVLNPSQLTQLKQNVRVNLEYIPDSVLKDLIKTEVCLNSTIDEENVFDSNDLSCLQQLDSHLMPSQTVQMTTKETNSFIADYLNSHQSVFDSYFFQNILPVLSEILMVCMDEFTELLIRIKKAENFSSEELRQQEVKLAMKSFCTMVSTYSEKLFPNLNSVMYKINQNKTKKGLIIALILFVANSLCITAPKFKGQIHTMRKMLLCMCQIRKINSPLLFNVLTTPEKIFNDELKLLIKILLVLQKNNVLAIPTTAMPETSSKDSIEEMCELIISSSTNCSSDSLSASKQIDLQKIEETLDHILNMLKQNNQGENSEIPETYIFESGPSHSLTQQDVGQVLAESLDQDQAGGLDSLFESYLKSTSSTNGDLKTELDDGEAELTYSSDFRGPVLAKNINDVIKVEED